MEIYDNAKFLNEQLHGLAKFKQALELIETAYCAKPKFRMQQLILEMINEWIRIAEKTVINCKLKEEGYN